MGMADATGGASPKAPNIQQIVFMAVRKLQLLLHFSLLTMLTPPWRYRYTPSCCACKQLKPLSEFKLRAKGDRYGRKGDPTSKCAKRTLRNRLSRQRLKCKHANAILKSVCPQIYAFEHAKVK